MSEDNNGIREEGCPIGVEIETGVIQALYSQNDARVVNEDSNFRYHVGTRNNRFENNRIRNDRGDHGSDSHRGRKDFANKEK
ncbi:hypothetical protein TNCV_4931491 [Trichonephila clavipes]|nr:hypothetical protein TNCV_4931491 [Trichonephila clavipes]